jgi:hypothetical protein
MIDTLFTTPGRGRTFDVGHSSYVARRSRRGISLLEVLFAIFVAAVGLLGLAALLTVGGVHTAQTEQADRSAAFARAACRDIEAREMLRPFVGGFRADPTFVNTPNWRDVNNVGWPVVNPTQVDVTHYQRLNPFVIDPLFVARYYDEQSAPAPAVFPHFVDAPVTGIPALNGLQLLRLTLAGMYSTTAGVSTASAERVFRCHDDLAFFEYQRDGRPNAGPDTNNNGVLDPNEIPEVAITYGNYSYLVMVTPAEAENPVPSTAPYAKAVALDQRRLFTVQVVVFYKRVMAADPLTPSERQVLADVSSQSAILRPSNSAFVHGLAANQWILLSAFLKPPSDDATLTNRPIHRWVRIRSIGKSQNPGELLINFAGPDWDSAITTTPGQAAVTIVDGIVTVHERVVELDARSMTAP